MRYANQPIKTAVPLFQKNVGHPLLYILSGQPRSLAALTARPIWQNGPSIRISWVTYRPQHNVMLRADKLEMRKCLLNLSLTQPTQNSDRIWKTYELIIKIYITLKIYLKKLGLDCELYFSTLFLLLSAYFITHDV